MAVVARGAEEFAVREVYMRVLPAAVQAFLSSRDTITNCYDWVVSADRMTSRILVYAVSRTASIRRCQEYDLSRLDHVASSSHCHIL